LLNLKFSSKGKKVNLGIKFFYSSSFGSKGMIVFFNKISSSPAHAWHNIPLIFMQQSKVSRRIRQAESKSSESKRKYEMELICFTKKYWQRNNVDVRLGTVWNKFSLSWLESILCETIDDSRDESCQHILKGCWNGCKLWKGY